MNSELKKIEKLDKAKEVLELLNGVDNKTDILLLALRVLIEGQAVLLFHADDAIREALRGDC